MRSGMRVACKMLFVNLKNAYQSQEYMLVSQVSFKVLFGFTTCCLYIYLAISS